MRFPFLAQRLFNVPLAITPDKAEMVIAALAERLGVTHLFSADGKPVTVAMASLGAEPDEPPEWYGYDVVGDAVAVIEVSGTLTHRLGALRPYSGMTGYDGIRLNFLHALADPAVKAIALDIHSPGGEVSGCFDLADTIFRARGTKPIWAILNDCAYSAAYALAAAADRVTVPRTGGAGSIGVIFMHVDFSKALGKAGVAVTLLKYGERKDDGNEYEPLAKAVRERFQARISATGELFVAAVASYRGIAADAVRAQEAGLFQGQGAVDAGLADDVMAPDQALAELVDSL